MLPKKFSPRAADIETLDLIQPFDEADQVRFLELVSRGASQHRAASEIHVPFWRISREALERPEFAKARDAALEARSAALEEIAIDYAVHGVQRDVVVGKGENQRIESVTEYNPHALLQFLLKGQQREKYGTERVQSAVSVSQAPPMIRTDADALRLASKVREQLRAMLPPIEGEAVEVKPDDGSDLL